MLWIKATRGRFRFRVLREEEEKIVSWIYLTAATQIRSKFLWTKKIKPLNKYLKHLQANCNAQKSYSVYQEIRSFSENLVSI